LCAVLPLAQAESNPPSKQAKFSAGSPNSLSITTAVPQAVFVMPRMPSQGKDPFFPRSMHPYSTGPIPTNNEPVAIVYDLHLKALSGSGEHRLALINNHTFEMGEEAEVTTATGRIRIKCVDIHGDVVLVQVGGERRELRLRSGI
jgi:hypothetical protein